MRCFPALAAKLCEFHDAWVVGSAAAPKDRCPASKGIDMKYENYTQGWL